MNYAVSGTLLIYPTGAFNQTGVINEILLERRRELWGEGFRLYDILRLQTAPVRKETTETFVDANGATQPVRGHWITKFPDGSNLIPNKQILPVPNSVK